MAVERGGRVVTTTESERLRAAFMDTVYREADRDDVAFYRERATAAEGHVLELGCGGGRIYLEVLAAGVDADGIDRSAHSLAVLREKASERNLSPSVWQADMSAFTVDQAYDLIYCPFNAIQELTTIEDQQNLLESAYDALDSDGTLVFDTFVPDFEFIASTWGEWQHRTVQFRGKPVEFQTRTRLVDTVSQEYISEKRAVWPDGSELFSFEGRAALLPAREIELLARNSPFESWHATGDYTDEPLADGHSAQVWALEK